MIKKTLLACVALLAGLLASVTCAQDGDGHGHSDVEFGYENAAIVVESGAEGFVFEGDFPLDGIDRQFTREPGFASALEEGSGLNAGDQITYNVLDDLVYWNNGFQSVPAGAQIRIVNQPPAPVVPDTVVSATSGTQRGGLDPVRNRIGEADENGDFHHDLQMFLEPNVAPEPVSEALFGAYGIKLSLSSDAAGIEESNPFFMVFNFGLEDQLFEDGVAAYAALVPEPATSAMAWLGLMLINGFRCQRCRESPVLTRVHRSKSTTCRLQ
jgi:hypothetical protein